MPVVRVVIVFDVEMASGATLDNALSMSEEASRWAGDAVRDWPGVLNPPLLIRVEADGAMRLPPGRDSEG